MKRGDYVILGESIKAEEYKQYVDNFALALKASSYLDQDAKKWNIVVFSDDIEWYKENQDKMGLDKFGNIIFINACKHNKEPFL